MLDDFARLDDIHVSPGVEALAANAEFAPFAGREPQAFGRDWCLFGIIVVKWSASGGFRLAFCRLDKSGEMGELALGLAVLLEELRFRSLLLGGLSPILPLPLLLIGVSIFFGLLHSLQGLWGMVGTGLAGFILGFLFIWQGSILIPVMAHYVTNARQIGLAMRRMRG